MSTTEILIPEGITLEVEAHRIKATKDNTTIERNFVYGYIEFEKKDKSILIKRLSDDKKTNSIIQTVQTHITNIFTGLEKPFEYKLEVVFSHFPMNVAKKDSFVEINNFLGGKQLRKSKILPNVEVTIKGKDITVTSANKEAAGQTSANMEMATKVKGKDKRVYQDGIFIVEKPE